MTSTLPQPAASDAANITPPAWRRIIASLRPTRASYALMGLFMLTIFAIIYMWWPLAEEVLSYVKWAGAWWRYMDWLLIGVFLFMSATIMAGADVRRDALIILVGACGGLVIESWGTQTSIWTYYTFERPPLWIIPAWPIASLSIDRITRVADELLPRRGEPIYRAAYWIIFSGFLALMLVFVWPTIQRSMTLAALALCVTLIATPKDHRLALITFAAGSGLGYFLERWGTTRQCWNYYTLQTPPLFAVLAHGMAAVAFWRTGTVLRQIMDAVRLKLSAQREPQSVQPG